jgi:hypothetical protein
VFVYQQIKPPLIRNNLALKVYRLQDEVKLFAFVTAGGMEQGEQAHRLVMLPRAVNPRVKLEKHPEFAGASDSNIQANRLD